MPFGFPISLALLVLGVVFLGGTVKGVVGFGYSVGGTALLALLPDVEPATAIVVMIIPILVSNLSLLSELDSEGVKSCYTRFRSYIAAALVGAVVGTVFVGRVPRSVVALVLGTLVLVYVAARHESVDLPPGFFGEGTGVKAVMGLASGVVFGSSNIGVQTAVYLDRLSLDHSTFVGVLSMYLVGISTMRAVAAWMLGIYGSPSLVWLSAVASIGGLAGVWIGVKARGVVPSDYCHTGFLVVLTAVGLRLAYVGVTGVI